MRLFFSVIGIFVILVWAYNMVDREIAKRKLRESDKVIEAKILEASCYQRHRRIKIQIGEKVYWERTQVSLDTCIRLSTQPTIKVKIDADENIIFADEGYNPESSFDLLAFVMIFLFVTGMMIYLGILPFFRGKV